MGIFQSTSLNAVSVPARPDRLIFIRNCEVKKIRRNVRLFTVFCMDIYYQRYNFTIWKTYFELKQLETTLRKNHLLYMSNISSSLPLQTGFCCPSPTDNSLLSYATSFLQLVFDIPELFESDLVRSFLGISKGTFLPDMGRVGKEGILWKSSGGYSKKFSNRAGDYVPIWSKRYFIFRENHFTWYDPIDLNTAKGMMMIDDEFHIILKGRSFVLVNKTRRLKVRTFSTKSGLEWNDFFMKFYLVNRVPRNMRQLHRATFPQRNNIDVKAYTLSKDYMAAVSVALLSAQKEIFITSWKNSPGVLLCRPPLPPIRLDQLLKYKADIGVKIYILLYKEVELASQGNDSLASMNYLMKLSPNIQCIRHPNKFIGGATAIMWSHHEKLVIVDRSIAFVGGIDLAYSRWDDELHTIDDEDGIKFPGADYRQPGKGKFQLALGMEPSPTLTPPRQSISNHDIKSVVGSSSHMEKMIPTAPPIAQVDDTSAHSNADAAAASATCIPVEQRKSAVSMTDVMNNFADKARSQISEGMSNLAESAKNQFNKMVVTPYMEKAKRDAFLQSHEVRELFPRTGWHDVHASINGLAARDVASHFIQRWNHHRLSCNVLTIPSLLEISDSSNYSKCARCQVIATEADTYCPSCNYYLGDASEYSKEPASHMIPPPLSTYSFVSFQCSYLGSTGCTFQGDGPVVVQQSDMNVPETSVVIEVVYDDDHRSNKESMLDAAVPQVGDILVAVNDVCVTHLNHKEFSRYVKRIRHKYPRDPIQLTFRRHLVFEDDKAQAALDLGIELIQPMPSAPPLEIDDEIHVGIHVSNDDGSSASAPALPIPLIEAQLVSEDDVQSNILHVDNAIAVLDEAPLPRQETQADKDAMRYALAKETLYAMSCLYHEVGVSIPLPKRSKAGNSKVQVLRSIGPWSVGINTESSIMNAWKDAILGAKKYIYIENQFFIGSLAGSDVKNIIPSVILERILQAVANKEDFKVIIIIPQHPSGDIAQSPKPRIILNYEYNTISRGRTSLIEQLKAKLPPGVPFTKYLNFYCLRSHGILNEKFYSDQIYVHDKILIADDRVAIVGSANINDRSMLGDRDSEVAIRYEDTEFVNISLGRSVYEAGKTVFDFRMRLMGQHVGMSPHSGELVDILKNEVFDKAWHGIASSNTWVYDTIDGSASVYKCETLSQYRNAISEYKNPSVHDPVTKELMGRIQGFLVHWPLQFLAKEDLSPPIAIRTVVPNQLWV